MACGQDVRTIEACTEWLQQNARHKTNEIAKPTAAQRSRPTAVAMPQLINAITWWHDITWYNMKPRVSDNLSTSFHGRRRWLPNKPFLSVLLWMRLDATHRYTIHPQSWHPGGTADGCIDTQSLWRGSDGVVAVKRVPSPTQLAPSPWRHRRPRRLDEIGKLNLSHKSILCNGGLLNESNICIYITYIYMYLIFWVYAEVCISLESG